MVVEGPVGLVVVPTHGHVVEVARTDGRPVAETVTRPTHTGSVGQRGRRGDDVSAGPRTNTAPRVKEEAPNRFDPLHSPTTYPLCTSTLF